MHVKQATTVLGSREEVERQWQEFHAHETPDWLSRASLRFADAPGGRGTEIHVRLEASIPGGRIGKAVATVAGEDPDQNVKLGLLRFKQWAETGEVVRSDGTPEGPAAKRLLRQRPAQPVGAGAER